MKDKIKTSLSCLKYCLIAYVEICFGQIIGMFLIENLLNPILSNVIPQFASGDVWNTAYLYYEDIGIWFAFLLICFRDEKKLLNTINRYKKGNTVKYFIIGMLIGFGTNFLCAVFAFIHHDISISYSRFNLIPLLFILLGIFIQSSAEEIMCRGYLYEMLIKRTKSPWIAMFVSSAFFAMIHIFNDGVTPVALLSIFFAGIVPALMMYYFDSMWACMAEHTMWNFTQNIILGLPNSGINVPYHIFNLNTAKDSFFYNVNFGIEGSCICVVVVAFTALCIYMYGKKRQLVPTDIWSEEDYLNATKGMFDDYNEAFDEEFAKTMEKDYQKFVTKGMKKGNTYSLDDYLDYVEKDAYKTLKYDKYIFFGIPLVVVLIVFFILSTSLTTSELFITISIMFIAESLVMFVLYRISKKGCHKRLQWVKQQRTKTEE